MLKLDKICVVLPDFSLKDISLEIEKGEYHILLGPSGSGKTMLLNTIAGFQKLKSGEIFLNNQNISDVAPNKRDVSLLFQDLALFPHLNVFENIAFPLQIRKLPKNVIAERVEEYLSFTEISDLKYRRIDKLSGGERQRVALARILVTKSELLMLDEPFSAIDSQLKLSLKKLLKKISGLGVTIIHVTHNLEEAINLADRVSVIENGKITQTGSIESVFSKPKNSFIASFSGNRNYFTSIDIIRENDSDFAVILANSDDKLETKIEKILIELPNYESQNIQGLIIDSKNIIISENRINSSARNNFEGDIVSIFKTEHGFDIEVNIGIKLWISVTKHSFDELNLTIGKKVWICFKASAVIVIS